MSRIAFDKLLNTITTHRARRHGVFPTLAARKHPPDVLTRYLVNMATFSAALRNLDVMRKAFGLWPHGSEMKQFRMRSAYQAINYIGRREANNEAQFDAMARLLTADASNNTTFVVPTHNVDGRNVLTPGMHVAMHALRHRSGDTSDDMFRALGGLFATEIAWYEQVTPSHVAAFVDSGHYGLTLNDVPYLKDLVSAENKDQEAWMSWMVDNVTMTDDEWQLMHDGAVEVLDSLTNFYDDLEAILKDGNPA